MDHTVKSTKGEEIANSISHGVAVLLAIAAIPILVVNAVRYGDTPAIIAGAVFGVSLLTLYLASTLYHAFPVLLVVLGLYSRQNGDGQTDRVSIA